VEASCAVDNLDEWLKERQVASDLIKQHLHKGSLRMKQQADKSRSERKFEVGDSVFLKLQPYVQTSLAPRANQKLAYKYFGPIKVLHPVGQVAYRVELPPPSLHLVFHVSQLKKVVSEGTVVSTSLPGDLPDLQFPEAVLKRRVVSKGLRSVVQVLVKWSSSPAELATWEDLQPLKQRFPHAPA
jgi:hypothetical protein